MKVSRKRAFKLLNVSQIRDTGSKYPVAERLYDHSNYHTFKKFSSAWTNEVTWSWSFLQTEGIHKILFILFFNVIRA